MTMTMTSGTRTFGTLWFHPRGFRPTKSTFLAPFGSKNVFLPFDVLTLLRIGEGEVRISLDAHPQAGVFIFQTRFKFPNAILGLL